MQNMFRYVYRYPTWAMACIRGLNWAVGEEEEPSEWTKGPKVERAAQTSADGPAGWVKVPKAEREAQGSSALDEGSGGEKKSEQRRLLFASSTQGDWVSGKGAVGGAQEGDAGRRREMTWTALSSGAVEKDQGREHGVSSGGGIAVLRRSNEGVDSRRQVGASSSAVLGDLQKPPWPRPEPDLVVMNMCAWAQNATGRRDLMR
jgi:hypothetical protein